MIDRRPDRYAQAADMVPQMSRRALLAAAPLALTACGKAEAAYFGKTDPPESQRLVYLIGTEPGTLDPAKSVDLWEGPIIGAMFEGLTHLHRQTGEPNAGLATHYAVTADGLVYTFFLRGHPKPRGARLEDEAGQKSPFSSPPARWSDGVPITAHDFVYSWRRLVDPATAAAYAYLMFYVHRGEDIAAGKRRPEELAVRALDDFTIEVTLRAANPFFLRLVSYRFFFPVPRRAIEQDEQSWTQPGRMVSSGAFTLRERRPNERILLVRSETYYDAHAVRLQEVVFQPVVDGATSANLYKTGAAAFSMPMSPHVLPGLRRKKDAHFHPNFGIWFLAVDTRKAPFNDVRVRYALNLATDKRTIADFLGDGRMPLAGLVPRLKDYQQPVSLPVRVDSVTFDALSFNPDAARSLLAKAGYEGKFSFEYLFPNLPDARPVAEIVQHQWRVNLGVDVHLVYQDAQTWSQTVYNVAYNGVAVFAELNGLEDPTWFLDMFTSTTAASGTGWSDHEYDGQLANAKAELDPGVRLCKLSDCEALLLRSMPCVPLYTDVWVYLCKPFVSGFGRNPFQSGAFRHAWIDTHWRPT